jgi:hypothetical protein
LLHSLRFSPNSQWKLRNRFTNLFSRESRSVASRFRTQAPQRFAPRVVIARIRSSSAEISIGLP